MVKGCSRGWRADSTGKMPVGYEGGARRNRATRPCSRGDGPLATLNWRALPGRPAALAGARPARRPRAIPRPGDRRSPLQPRAHPRRAHPPRSPSAWLSKAAARSWLSLSSSSRGRRGDAETVRARTCAEGHRQWLASEQSQSRGRLRAAKPSRRCRPSRPSHPAGWMPALLGIQHRARHRRAYMADLAAS